METKSNSGFRKRAVKFPIFSVLLTCFFLTAGCGGLNSPLERKDERKTGGKSAVQGIQGAIEEDFTISCFFTDAGDFKYIHPAYSEDEGSGAPWGFKHQGVDLITAKSGPCVLVPADGLVQQVVEYFNPVNNQWQVNLHVRCSDRISYNLFFEPRAHTVSEVALQRAAIRAAENDRVTAGDTLGFILNLSSEASGFGDVTVHFDWWVDGRNVCPEPYFKPEALSAMLSLLHAKYPDGRLCYPSGPSCVGDREPLGDGSGNRGRLWKPERAETVGWPR